MILIFIIICFITNSCANKSSPQIVLKQVDTVTLDYKITQVRSIYYPEYNTQVNTYFRNYSNGFAFCFCIDSITPTTFFPVKSLISNYIVENRESLIVQYATGIRQDPILYRINFQENIIDTVHLDLGQRDDENLTLGSMSFGFPMNPDKNGERFYYSNVFLESTSNYLNSKESRIRKYSSGFASELLISKNKIKFTQKTVGHFPKIHLSDEVYNQYFPWIALNKNLDFITCYFFIDSIFVTHPDNSQEHFPLLSKYKTTPSKPLDHTKSFDYDYLSKDANERLSYMYLRYDYYNNLYYVVAAKPMPFENEDGTRNNPADKSWSLIVLDSTFKQIAEIDMPDHLSKHEIMVTQKGIAVHDQNLTTLYPGKTVFVIYKLEKK